MNPISQAHPAESFRSFRAAGVALHKVSERLASWSARRRAARELMLLSDGELQDIGVSRAQALYESRRRH